MPKDEQNLDEIEQKISSLIKYRSSLINELRRLYQKRREIRKETKETWDKENKERSALSEQYRLLKQLKDTREEIHIKINKIKGKVDDVDKALNRFDKKVPHESEIKLTQKLEKMEWKLQTERLTRDEEKQMIGYIKELEFELYLWKKAYSLRQELNLLLSEVDSLKGKLAEFEEEKRSSLYELKNRKGLIHKIVMTKQQLLQEDENIEQDITELEENLNYINADLSKLNQRKRLKESTIIRSKEEKLIEETRSKVKDKISKEKSLSWDELKIFLEEDKSESFK